MDSDDGRIDRILEAARIRDAETRESLKPALASILPQIDRLGFAIRFHRTGRVADALRRVTEARRRLERFEAALEKLGAVFSGDAYTLDVEGLALLHAIDARNRSADLRQRLEAAETHLRGLVGYGRRPQDVRRLVSEACGAILAEAYTRATGKRPGRTRDASGKIKRDDFFRLFVVLLAEIGVRPSAETVYRLIGTRVRRWN